MITFGITVTIVLVSAAVLNNSKNKANASYQHVV
jgi:hypothetical protein